MSIQYVEGDLFDYIPAEDDTITIVPHVCNSIGVWGSGFVVPLGRRYPDARKAYIEAMQAKLVLNLPFALLSFTQFVPVEDGKVLVANMIAQEGVGPKFENGKMIPPIRYPQLAICMEAVRKKVEEYQLQDKKVKIACPLFGAGLAGGDWKTIQELIQVMWDNIPTTVYVLPEMMPEIRQLIGEL